jgi:hypothetical protein
MRACTDEFSPTAVEEFDSMDESEEELSESNANEWFSGSSIVAVSKLQSIFDTGGSFLTPNRETGESIVATVSESFKSGEANLAMGETFGTFLSGSTIPCTLDLEIFIDSDVTVFRRSSLFKSKKKFSLVKVNTFD